jgi:hypothetical protein
LRINADATVELPIADAGRYANALAQVGELQDDTRDAAVEGPSFVRVDGVADAQTPPMFNI